MRGDAQDPCRPGRGHRDEVDPQEQETPVPAGELPLDLTSPNVTVHLVDTLTIQRCARHPDTAHDSGCPGATP